MANFLFEQLVGLSEKIISAMKNRKVVKIYYEPVDDPKGGLKGYRDIEIFALGINRFGNTVIYAWVRNNFSSTMNSGRENDRVRWRMFRLDGITRFVPTIQKYDISDEYIQANRQKLNKLYNRSLPRVIKTVLDFMGEKPTEPEKKYQSIEDKVNDQYTLEENKNIYE